MALLHFHILIDDKLLFSHNFEATGISFLLILLQFYEYATNLLFNHLITNLL